MQALQAIYTIFFRVSRTNERLTDKGCHYLSRRVSRIGICELKDCLVLK